MYKNRSQNASYAIEDEPVAVMKAPPSPDIRAIKANARQQLRNEGWHSTDGIFTIPKGMARSESDSLPRLAIENPQKKNPLITSTPFGKAPVGEPESFLLSPIQRKTDDFVILFTSPSNQVTEKDSKVPTPLPSTEALNDTNSSTPMDRIKKLHERLEKKCEHYELMSKLKTEKIRSIKKELDVNNE